MDGYSNGSKYLPVKYEYKYKYLGNKDKYKYKYKYCEIVLEYYSSTSSLQVPSTTSLFSTKHKTRSENVSLLSIVQLFLLYTPSSVAHSTIAVFF